MVSPSFFHSLGTASFLPSTVYWKFFEILVKKFFRYLLETPEALVAGSPSTPLGQLLFLPSTVYWKFFEVLVKKFFAILRNRKAPLDVVPEEPSFYIIA